MTPNSPFIVPASYRLTADPDWVVRDDVTYTPSTDRHYQHWLALGNTPDPPARETLHQARRAARTAAETGGFIFNGHPFDSDRDSILRIANAATTALTANLLGAPFATEWHCADGYDMPLDAAGVMAMQGALAAHGQACHDRSSALRAMIEDPEADLDALAEEIKTGWLHTTLTEA